MWWCVGSVVALSKLEYLSLTFSSRSSPCFTSILAYRYYLVASYESGRICSWRNVYFASCYDRFPYRLSQRSSSSMYLLHFLLRYLTRQEWQQRTSQRSTCTQTKSLLRSCKTGEKASFSRSWYRGSSYFRCDSDQSFILALYVYISDFQLISKFVHGFLVFAAL